jgi:hypothetical protein
VNGRLACRVAALSTAAASSAVIPAKAGIQCASSSFPRDAFQQPNGWSSGNPLAPIKAVHGDVTALLDAGVLERSAEGVFFPYGAAHVDFTLKAA